MCIVGLSSANVFGFNDDVFRDSSGRLISYRDVLTSEPGADRSSILAVSQSSSGRVSNGGRVALANGSGGCFLKNPRPRA